MKYTRSLLPIIHKYALAITATLAMAASAQAITLVEDNFDDLAPGTLLTGQLPSTRGASAWQPFVNGQHSFAQSGGTINPNLDPVTNVQSGSTIAFGTYDTVANPWVTSQIDIVLGQGAQTWIGVNLSQGVGSPFGNIIALLDVTGGVNLLTNAASSHIANGSVADFNLASLYKMRLEYNYSAQLARIYVNDNLIIGNTSLLVNSQGAAVGPVAQVDQGGFFAIGPAENQVGLAYPNGSIDNFVVTAVPEPSTVAMLVAGMAGWVLISRVRRKSVA